MERRRRDHGLSGLHAAILPEGNKDDFYNLYAYTVASVLMKVLDQCGDSWTRENIMSQATNLKNIILPTLLPGVLVNTSPTNYAR